LAVDAQGTARLQLANARDLLHCHNLPRRTYCHKSEQLPVNWPPNTDTPGTESEKPGSETLPSVTVGPIQQDTTK
jgi:hypothetical protein